jgi:hypothetical protein
MTAIHRCFRARSTVVRERLALEVSDPSERGKTSILDAVSRSIALLKPAFI